ncbi:MAG: fibronectin type III domain-containing protein, partial [Bacteroidales bacterium]|nr:fibronectin type III domain-containing protein [Bacteroidales bacterium]
KSPTSINVSPKGQLKKGSKIGDAEVVDILNEEKTFDVPMKAGEGCYFLAITVNTSNPNKYAYSPANRLWVPARAAYNGFPGLLDMSKELCGIPNKENDGMKLTTQEFKTLEPNIYRDMPFGWTRDLTLANGEKQVAFGLGHPGYSINVPVALYATAIYTKACKTDAITVPILADKNRILVTYEMQLWKADASGFVDKANAEDNDKFQLQYALGNGTWQEMTSWTGKTLPAADENGVYKLTYSLVNDNLTGQYIRFRFVLNSVTRNNSTFVAIRAVEIKEDKVCKAPTDLTQTISQTTTTQFPVTWSDPNPTKATSYLVSYKRAEAVGDWTEKTVNTNSATLTGLRSSTTYLVRISANCGANGESYPSDTAYFTTAYTFPYTEAMAQRDTMFKIQGSNATVPLYSPFPGKSMYPALVRRDGGVNTYTGQLPVTGNNGTADLELASGDGSNAGVFSHSNTYYNKADIKMDDGYGVVRKQLKAVGVSERANYTWLITPVIYTVNLEEDQPITVRFRARSAKRVGGAGNPWTKGTVGDKYSAASLKVLVSNDGQFRNSDVIGTVNVGSDNIDSTLFEFDLTTPKTGSVQVAFYYANTSYINDNAQENNEDYMIFEIFDVRFEYKNEVAICPPLEGLERTFLTPHSATFSWAPSDSAKYYEFAYGPAEEDEYTNTVQLTDAEYTMTDLDEQTTYKVKVTGYCDEEGENAAPDPLTAEFTTPEGCHTPTGFKV